jgi:hypothetical protein
MQIPFIYVARANFRKKMLDIPNGLYKDKKLPNMCILFNDTDLYQRVWVWVWVHGVTKLQNEPW